MEEQFEKAEKLFWEAPMLQQFLTKETEKSDYWAVEMSTYTGPS